MKKQFKLILILQMHINLGVIFTQLGESQKAISYYEKAIQINPNHIHAHNNLGDYT